MNTIGWPIWPVSIAVQLTVAVLLLGSRLTPRNAFGRRLCAVLATTACVALIPSATGLIDTLDSTSRYLEQFFVFCGVLALLVLAVRLLFDANTWAALFCATTAYTMQNLASSAEQLARMVLLGRAQDLTSRVASSSRWQPWLSPTPSATLDSFERLTAPRLNGCALAP